MQVKKNHYTFNQYADIRRWCSYYYQIYQVLKRDVSNVLLIGEGDGIVSNVLRKNGINVTTFDFAADLNPDIVGDIREINKCINKTYDCIICCQVLEHLEFRYFNSIMKSFRNIINNNGIIILSLPQQKVWFKVYLNIGRLEIKKAITIPMFWKGQYKFNGEHYWEASSKGYSKKKILNICQKYFDIETHFTIWEFPYHWFIILKHINREEL